MKKEIVTESDKRMRALRSELNLKKIPYRLKSRTYVREKLYTFEFFDSYTQESIKLWQKICVSIARE